MKFRKDGTLQVQAGGRKGIYTLFVRANRENCAALRSAIEDRQRVRAAHLAQADRATREIDALEARLDAQLALLEQTNEEMHDVLVRQPSAIQRVLRLFTWRDPSIAAMAAGVAANGEQAA